jgi:GPH family glycoside/pentoside/hexuronide:cation symporter
MASDEELTKYEPFSNKKMIAFSLNLAILNAFWAMRNWLQLYAAKALGIPILLVLLIFGIYVVWDAVNDPLTGTLLDRSTKFTSKYGKRFPFIVIGLTGALLCITLLYLPVTENILWAAIWMLIILIIYDAFQTLYELSFGGLSVDRIRDQKQRVKMGTFAYILYGIHAIAFAVITPIILGIYGGVTNPWAFFMSTLVGIIVLVIISIPHILSAREPVEMKELRITLNEQGKSFSPPKEFLKRAFKDRNWMVLVITYDIFVVLTACVTIGTAFYVLDVLGLPIEVTAFTGLTFFLVSFVAVPIWMKIAKRIGSRKTFLYSLLITVISTASFIFATNLSMLIIIFIFFAVGVSGAHVPLNAIFSEAIDDATLKSGIREESSYLGILRFFSATALFWQILIFAIVGTTTGYDPQLGTNNSDFAKLGLLLQMSLIPAAVMLISLLFFMKFYTITKEQAIEIKKRLLELKL